MIVTKYVCDFCGKEVAAADRFQLEAIVFYPHNARAESGKAKYEGEFCSRACIGGFIAIDGKPKVTLPMPAIQFTPPTGEKAG